MQRAFRCFSTPRNLFYLHFIMENPTPFNQRLREAQAETNSLLCVGMDPDPDRFPAHLSRDAGGVEEFCRAIIRSTQSNVCAYKFNSAFFEVLGAEGFRILSALRDMVPPTVLCIYDVKRGDIGNTARQYARAAFDTFNMDAVTVNPYMGADAVEPFIQSPEHGAFVLCHTSNPGAADFQHRRAEDGTRLYATVAGKAAGWNTRDNIGLVVGATKEDSILEIRALAPTLPLLTPGIGAQGGDLAKVLNAGLLEDRGGLVVPVSRSILYAGSGRDFADAAAAAAAQLQTQINDARNL